MESNQWLKLLFSICIFSLVPLAGIEPALLAELDFESSASTNSATGAFGTLTLRRGPRSRRNIAGRDFGSTPRVRKQSRSMPQRKYCQTPRCDRRCLDSIGGA